VTIKYHVIFQIVFATLHQAVLSTGEVSSAYHPPQYYGQHDDFIMTSDDICNDITTHSHTLAQGYHCGTWICVMFWVASIIT